MGPDLAELLRQTEGCSVGLGIQWAISRTHQERFDLLERMMDECYMRLVDGRHLYHDKSEDELTVQIVSMLQMLSVNASHDTQVGGHCDILVRAPGGFLWIGEAKKYTGYTKLLDGFLQISTRYGVAQPGRDRGEIIIYFDKSDAQKMMKTWQGELLAKLLDVVLTHEVTEDGSLCFRTTHKCPASGCSFGVRHRAVPLYFSPKK